MKFTTFRYAKAKIKANKIKQENAFIIDVLKPFLGLKIYRGLKTPKSPYYVERNEKTTEWTKTHSSVVIVTL